MSTSENIQGPSKVNQIVRLTPIPEVIEKNFEVDE